MKKIVIALFLLCLTPLFPVTALGDDMETDLFVGNLKPKVDEVHIGPTGIQIPLERILLIHKDKTFCAVKFIKFWTEKKGQEKYAKYQVYCQKDGTGNFLNKNVKYSEEKASLLKQHGFFYPLIWNFGYSVVQCGNLELAWYPNFFVGFFEMGDQAGDYGIEMGPTPWLDIKEVNVFDSRIKWFKYDESRERVNVPIDKLWK